MASMTSLNIPCSGNFIDDDNDPITYVASYSFNGGAAVTIPSGIFSLVQSPCQVNVASTSTNDLGTYTISLTASDSFPSSITTTF